MNTRSNLRRSLQSIFDKIEFICEHGDFFDDSTGLAQDAYTLACRHGCNVAMPKIGTAHDALRFVGMLLAWADQPKSGEPMTVPQVARFLSVCQAKVRYWARNGELTATRSTGRGRPYKISRKSLEDFIDRRTFRPPRIDCVYALIDSTLLRDGLTEGYPTPWNPCRWPPLNH
jgi:excisionase family DNA binding protein